MLMEGENIDVVVLTGKMGSGKTTLAKKIKDQFYEGDAVVSSFAEPIRDICRNREMLSNFFVETKNRRFFKKEFVPLSLYAPFCDKLSSLDADTKEGEYPRKQLIFIGEFFKSVYGDDFWIKKLFVDFSELIKIQKAKKALVPKALIIDDMRFIKEYEMVSKISSVIVGIDVPEEIRLSFVVKNKKLKPGDDSTPKHKSEAEVDWLLDFIQYENERWIYSLENGSRFVSIKWVEMEPDVEMLKIILGIS
jgi:uridine kinase